MKERKRKREERRCELGERERKEKKVRVGDLRRVGNG